MNTIRETDCVYCLELPHAEDSSDGSEAYLLLCWVNLLVVESQYTRLHEILVYYSYSRTCVYQLFRPSWVAGFSWLKTHNSTSDSKSRLSASFFFQI